MLGVEQGAGRKGSISPVSIELKVSSVRFTVDGEWSFACFSCVVILILSRCGVNKVAALRDD